MIVQMSDVKDTYGTSSNNLVRYNLLSSHFCSMRIVTFDLERILYIGQCLDKINETFFFYSSDRHIISVEH